MTDKQYRRRDDHLREEAQHVIEQRKAAGLEGLTGGLTAIMINTEANRHHAAVQDFLRYTGYDVADAFEEAGCTVTYLARAGSADILLQTRAPGTPNPFAPLNRRPKSEHLPDTRLETYVFETIDIDRYVDAQTARGVTFLTPAPIEADDYRFIQTSPSELTGNSVGLVQWTGSGRSWRGHAARTHETDAAKPNHPHLECVGLLDHAATRVRAQDRDAAIIEFIALTDYHFDFAVYVPTLNSITNVARLGPDDFALVFTSGINPSANQVPDGPTERFVANYGPRTHHLAFHTDAIEDTVAAIGADGMGFLSELLGSPEQGLKQIFTEPSDNTLLVFEYIHRFDGFDGFFTRDNVTKLTQATDRQ